MKLWTQRELAQGLIERGVPEHAAAALVSRMHSNRLLEWAGMSAHGEPAFRLRVSIWVYPACLAGE